MKISFLHVESCRIRSIILLASVHSLRWSTVHNAPKQDIGIEVSVELVVCRCRATQHELVSSLNVLEIS